MSNYPPIPILTGELPDDNEELANIVVQFPSLADDRADPPVSIPELLDYLRDEAPDGEELQAEDLRFIRTAQVAERAYWIWAFREPGGGESAYLTVSQDAKGAVTIGYETDYYGLTPEQYMLGDYHGVF